MMRRESRSEGLKPSEEGLSSSSKNSKYKNYKEIE